MKTQIFLITIALLISFSAHGRSKKVSRKGRVDSESAAQASAPLARPAQNSKILEVTLFGDRASVKRRQHARIPSGSLTIPFHGVTPMADVESLKVQVADKKAVTVLGVRAQPNYYVRSSNGELNQLIVKQRELQRDVQSVTEKVQLLVQSNSNLTQLAEHYRDSFTLNLHRRAWSKSDFASFIKFLVDQSASLNGTWHKLYAEYREATRALERVNARVNELGSASDRHDLTILVDVLAEGAVDTSVDLQYLVHGSGFSGGWTPVYDLRVDSKSGNAKLEQYAYAWQTSGEDWDSVHLNLSNQRSELKPVPPSISSYTLSFQEVKKVQTGVSSKNDDAKKLSVDTDSDEGAPGSEKGLARVFKIPGTQTLKSGAARTRVFIARKTVPYTERLHVVGEQYNSAFRHGELENKLSWDLAPGALNLFYDGSFVQQLWLNGVARGNRFSINAGVDPDLMVSHWKNDKTEEPGLIDRRRHWLREISTQVHNWSGKPKTVRILDQVPISELKDVEVISKGTTDGFQKDDQNESWGYWDIKVAPRESQTVTVKLDVAVPKDFQFQW